MTGFLRRIYESVALVPCSDEVQVGDVMLYLERYPNEELYHIGRVVEPPDGGANLEMRFERMIYLDDPKLGVPILGDEAQQTYARLRSRMRHYPRCPKR